MGNQRRINSGFTRRSEAAKHAKTRVIVALVVLAACCVSANAQSASDNPRWVIGAYLGGARTGSSTLEISQPSLSNNLRFDKVRFSGRSFEGPLYYGLRTGYFFKRWLGVEAEFTHLKVFSDSGQQVHVSGTRRGSPIDRTIALGEIVQLYSISHGVNLLLINLAARRGFSRDGSGRPRLFVAGRAGVGPTIPHTESTIDGNKQEQYELGSIAFQFGGGAELRLAGALFLTGDYKFTRTRQNGKIFSGEAESLLTSNHGAFGLSYHF